MNKKAARIIENIMEISAFLSMLVLTILYTALLLTIFGGN